MATIAEPLKQETPASEMMITYMTLRAAVGVLGIALPAALIGGTMLFEKSTVIYGSMSAYYYTCTRNLLIGILCSVAVFLLCYHGPQVIDRVASKMAGLFAVCIAFFPTSATNDKGDVISILHYLFAGAFFVILSCMSLFLFTKSSGDVTPEKRMRNRVYIFCGIVMLVCVVAIPLDGLAAIKDRIAFLKPTLVLETVALLAFGLSWLTKGELWLGDKKKMTAL